MNRKSPIPGLVTLEEIRKTAAECIGKINDAKDQGKRRILAFAAWQIARQLAYLNEERHSHFVTAHNHEDNHK